MASSQASSLDRTSSGKTSSAVSTRQSLVSSSKSSMLGDEGPKELLSDVSDFAFPPSRLLELASSALVNGREQLLLYKADSPRGVHYAWNAVVFFASAVIDLLSYRGVDVSAFPSGSLASCDLPSISAGPAQPTFGAVLTFSNVFRNSIQGLVEASMVPALAAAKASNSDAGPWSYSLSRYDPPQPPIRAPTQSISPTEDSVPLGVGSVDSAEITLEKKRVGELAQIMAFAELLPSILQDARGFVESELIDAALHHIAVLKRRTPVPSLGTIIPDDVSSMEAPSPGFRTVLNTAQDSVEFPSGTSSNASATSSSSSSNPLPTMTPPTSGNPTDDSAHLSPTKSHTLPQQHYPHIPSRGMETSPNEHHAQPRRTDSQALSTRSRTNSIISLSLAFTPRSVTPSDGGESPDGTGWSSPRSPVTSVHSTRSMFSVFPTRPHTLFSLRSSSSISEDHTSAGPYDVLRKSPLATAEVVTATSPVEDVRFLWSTVSVPDRPQRRDKGKGRAYDHDANSTGPVTFPSDRPSPNVGPKAHDLLSALHARERSNSITTPVAFSPPESFLTRARTRATSLHPRALLPNSWRNSDTSPAPAPSLIVTRPSTSPSRPLHGVQSTSSLSPPLLGARSHRRRSFTPPSSSSCHANNTLGAMPALHPSLAAVERSSRLLKSSVTCAVCGDTGRDFPRCGRCGEAWCSRTCRVRSLSLAEVKRHVCTTGQANTKLAGGAATIANGARAA